MRTGNARFVDLLVVVATVVGVWYVFKPGHTTGMTCGGMCPNICKATEGLQCSGGGGECPEGLTYPGCVNGSYGQGTCEDWVPTGDENLDFCENYNTPENGYECSMGYDPFDAWACGCPTDDYGEFTQDFPPLD